MGLRNTTEVSHGSRKLNRLTRLDDVDRKGFSTKADVSVLDVIKQQGKSVLQSNQVWPEALPRDVRPAGEFSGNQVSGVPTSVDIDPKIIDLKKLVWKVQLHQKFAVGKANHDLEYKVTAVVLLKDIPGLMKEDSSEFGLGDVRSFDKKLVSNIIEIAGPRINVNKMELKLSSKLYDNRESNRERVLFQLKSLVDGARSL